MEHAAPPFLPLPSLFGAKKRHRKPVWTEKIEWSKATKAHCSEDGSGGVIFVEFAEDSGLSPVVVKGSSTVAQEVFAYEMCKTLGIPAPQYFIAEHTQKQWTVIKSKLARLVGPTALIKVQRELNRPFIIVMEQVRGGDLFSLINDGMRVASDDPNDRQRVYTSVIEKILLSDDNLHQMGAIMSMDVLLNNWDRLPLIWSNDGNLSNFLFMSRSTGGYEICAIDQAIFPVSRKVLANYEQYMGKVKSLIDSLLVESLIEPGSPIAKVRDSIFLWTNFDIGQAGMLALRHGLLIGLERIARLLSNHPFDAIKQYMSKWCIQDWEDVWKNGMESINTEFMEDIVSVLTLKHEAIRDCLTRSYQAGQFARHSLEPFKSCQKGGHSRDSIKITTVQQATADATSLRIFLEGEEPSDRSDILLLFEYWLPFAFNSQPIESQPAFAPYLELAKDHQIYICLGAGLMLNAKQEQFCTSVLIGPSGYIGSYNKRYPLSATVTPGSGVGVWDTPIGRLAILICFDIENADAFDDTMALQPDVLLNPILIPRGGEEVTFSAWSLGLDGMNHKFEALSREFGCVIARCDSDQALGSSQTISPLHTVTAPTNGPCIFSTHVAKVRKNGSNSLPSYPFASVDSFESICDPPERPRTERRDNTGSRYLVHSLEHSSPVSTASFFQEGKMLAVAPCSSPLQIFNATSAKPMLTIETPSTVLHMVPHVGNLISSDSQKLFGIDVETGAVTDLPSAVEFGSISAFTSAGPSLYAGCESGKVFWVDDRVSDSSEWLSLAAKAPVNHLAVCSHQIVTASKGGLVQLFDARKPEESFGIFQSQSSVVGLVLSESLSQVTLAYPDFSLQVKLLSSFQADEAISLQIANVDPSAALVSLGGFDITKARGSYLVGGVLGGAVCLIRHNQEDSSIVHTFREVSGSPFVRTDGTGIFISSKTASKLIQFKQNRVVRHWADSLL